MPLKTTRTSYKPGPKDNCQTPWYAILPLLPWIEKKSKLTGKKPVIWEPAAGDGYLAQALRISGYDVISTDIQYHNSTDFLTDLPDRPFDMIISNPPFSSRLKHEFVRRCLSLNVPFSLIMTTETISNTSIREELSSIDLLILNGRVDYKMPYKGWAGKGADFPTIWFTSRLLTKQLTYCSHFKMGWRNWKPFHLSWQEISQQQVGVPNV